MSQTQLFRIVTPHPQEEKRLVWSAEFSPKGLARLKVEFASPRDKSSTLSDARARDLERKILKRLDGKDAPMDFSEFDLAGAPPFHLRIWRAMHQIPFGQTLSYGDVAGEAGSPMAARAAGQACGANRILLFIPCHRVLASNGIGGFGCGLHWKKMLLGMEGVTKYSSMIR
jgi:methylated-DNA-[protein]-cysteine S-methyltransferase